MSNDNDFIAKLAASMAADYAKEIKARLTQISRKCESPIERMMAAAMYAADWSQVCAFDFIETLSIAPYWDTDIGILRDHSPLDTFVVIEPQHEIAGYRADFLVTLQTPYHGTHRAIVECDGHDFHDKTKQQAQRDKARDRKLQAAGPHVLRFTGSEIFRDANSCAASVVEHFEVLLGRLEG